MRSFPGQSVPALVLTFLAASAACGQSFTKVTTGAPVSETGAWRSVNWVDYDRDGDLDLFVTRGKSGGQDNVLFRNDGGPGFSFTRMSGLAISQDGRSSDGATWADYDNDGFPDAFVANWYNQNNLLYRNAAGGSLTRILSGPAVNDGGYSETGSWGDFNNDGLADLYVANSSGSRLNFLYRNSGNGQFVKVESGRQSTDAGTSRGVNWVDYDDDGDLDLFVANESNENDFLYRNMLAESGIDTFQRVLAGPLVNSGGSTWSASWADYDNDGDQDVFVANHGFQAGKIFVNDGAGNFEADTTGPLPTTQAYGASGSWGDFDNDGDLDLVVTQAYSSGPAVTNMLYRNMLAETDTARLERVTAGPVVADAGFQYGAAWGDYDGDGDLDLYVARTYSENQANAFYRNDGNANHWLTLDLRGTASNGAAIGAKVRAKSVMGGTPVWQLRVVEGQSGYCGQNLQLHFGLRDAAVVDSLVIEWPSGAVETFTNVAADRHLVTAESDSTPPSPVSPAPGYVNELPSIRLTWTRALHYPPYRVQVSTDPGFAGGMVADTVVGGDTTVVLPVSSTGDRYYWRVSPARALRGLLWSAVRSFDNDVQAPGAASPLLPGQGATNVPVSTHLRWSVAPGATAYRVRVSTDSAAAPSQIDTTVSDTALATGTLPHFTAIFWTVEPLNFTGPGPLSAVSAYTTIIAPPALPAQSSPSDGESAVAVPAVLAWHPAERAASYRVQFSPESLFIPPFVRESVVSDTALAAADLASFTTYHWRLRSINDGGQSAYTAAREFRTVIAAPQPSSPADGASQFTSVMFVWRPSPPASSYRLQYGTDSTFQSVAFDDSTISDTAAAASLAPSLRYYWRVRAVHPEGVSPWSATRSLVTALDTFVVATASEWRLVSLPGNVPDRSSAAAFPGAVTPFYRYEGGYTPAETLEYGEGYWVKFPVGAEHLIAGTKRFSDTIGLETGWNLVGPVSTPVAVSSIVASPAGLVTSPAFGYDGGFRREDTLRAGKGYWIRAQQPGTIYLGPAQIPATAGRLVVSAEHAAPPGPPGETEAIVGPAELPSRTSLFPNYPNPFNPVTELRFDLASPSEVTIDVFSSLGERVETLVDASLGAGRHSVTWNAGGFASGVYYARMKAGAVTQTTRLLLVR